MKVTGLGFAALSSTPTRTVPSAVAPRASTTRYRNETCPLSPGTLVYMMAEPSAVMTAAARSG